MPSSQLATDPLLQPLHIKVQKLLCVPVCTLCDEHIPLLQVPRHARRNHQILGIQDSPIITTLQALGAKKDDIPLPTDSPPPFPYQGLKVTEGFRCTSCGFVYASLRSGNDHDCEEDTNARFSLEVVYLQALRIPKLSHFLVQAPSEASESSDDPEIMPSPDFHAAHQAVLDFRQPAPLKERDQRAISAWLKFTQWTGVICFDDLPFLRKLVSSPKDDMVAIQMGVISFFDDVLPLINDVPYHILTQLNNPDRSQRYA
jgi:hypothetical protein